MKNVRKQGRFSNVFCGDGGRLRRIFIEIGLFSELFKTEVNEYIAAKGSRRGRKDF